MLFFPPRKELETARIPYSSISKSLGGLLKQEWRKHNALLWLQELLQSRTTLHTAKRKCCLVGHGQCLEPPSNTSLAEFLRDARTAAHSICQTKNHNGGAGPEQVAKLYERNAVAAEPLEVENNFTCYMPT